MQHTYHLYLFLYGATYSSSLYFSHPHSCAPLRSPADIHLGNDWSTFPPTPIMSQATPERLKAFYKSQLNDPSYQMFLRTTNTTVLGTIDDHDMGMNNGDETYEFKQQSGVQFLEFIGEDRSNIMFQRVMSGHGVYGVKVFDFDNSREGNHLLSDEEAGIDPDVVGYDIEMKNSPREYKEKRVAIFVLDARTNRSPWGKGFDAWKRNYSGDFLGERQWNWFETALLKSNAAVNIVVNGLQVHPFRHPNANTAEQWAQFPTSRQRLYDAILKGGASAPLLISGDVHMAQLMRKDCWLRNDQSSLARPLIEFTTSGMTHSWGSVFASSQKFHDTWKYYPMHVMSKTIMTVAHWVFPMPDLMISGTTPPNNDDDSTLFENGGAEGSKQGQQYSLDKNFGELEIDWVQKSIAIRAFGEDSTAPPLLSASFSMDQLSGLEPIPGAIRDIQSLQDRGGFLVDGNIIKGSESVCVNHRGTANNAHFLIGMVAMTLVLSFFLLGPQFLLVRFILKRWKSIKRDRTGYNV